MAPAFSPIPINPRKRVMTPINLKEMSTLSDADLKIPSVRVLKIAPSPVVIQCKNAVTKAMMKKKNQM
jgi:hypothetical protein